MEHHSEAFVALDTAKLRNAVAIADAGRSGEIRYLGEFDNTEVATRKLVAKLASKHTRLTFCYEAGPTGYGLFRLIKSLGHDCIVVAPSLIPSKPGDRVKTNRRDAVNLAKLLRAGELTAVWVPDERHEAMRDLVRARDAMREAVADWTLAPVIEAVQAMRGIDMIGALAFLAELGDLSRFENPRQLMAYLGLTPSERSTGESVKRGGITKAGNTRARRLLIEAAWSYRFPPRVSKDMQTRIGSAPRTAREIAWKAQMRLCGRFRTLTRKGKRSTIVVAAIARELSAFIWAINREVVGSRATAPQ
jgi:transposase